MAGGEPGTTGKNTWIRRGQALASDGGSLVNGNGHSKEDGVSVKKRKGDAIINLGGMNQCSMKAGDRIVISEFLHYSLRYSHVRSTGHYKRVISRLTIRYRYPRRRRLRGPRDGG